MTAAASAGGEEGAAGAGLQARAALLEEKFERHFAERQLRSDQFGTTLGTLVYLSLIPSLSELGRRDLVAAAVACSLLCLWPTVLARFARDLYAARRDYLLLAHFLFHYAIGAQLARFVRLSNKFAPTSPASFLGSFVLSSTVLWQSLDAMMYRMRAHRFVLLKPIVLLAVLPLERSLCWQACDSMPGMAHHFSSAAELVGLLVAPFRPVPPSLAAGDHSTAGAVLSCIKVQAFMLALLAYVLPLFVLRRLELQMITRFAARQRQLLASAAPGLASSSSSHGGSSASLQNCASSSSRSRGRSRCSSSSGGRPALLRRVREARQLWQLQRVKARLQREQGPAAEQAGAGGGGGSGGSSSSDGGTACCRWDAWAVPLLLTGLCWHAIDTLVW